mmetsp:Transcript_127791/g.319102  ORF Transcript_127791/g.319102 Transcript_127791/m.319102 type:complete len:249 (-) Transcript_127791:484-1230(-)
MPVSSTTSTDAFHSRSSLTASRFFSRHAIIRGVWPLALLGLTLAPAFSSASMTSMLPGSAWPPSTAGRLQSSCSKVRNSTTPSSVSCRWQMFADTPAANSSSTLRSCSPSALLRSASNVSPAPARGRRQAGVRTCSFSSINLLARRTCSICSRAIFVESVPSVWRRNFERRRPEGVLVSFDRPRKLPLFPLACADTDSRLEYARRATKLPRGREKELLDSTLNAERDIAVPGGGTQPTSCQVDDLGLV